MIGLISTDNLLLYISPTLLILHSASFLCRYHWTLVHLNRNFGPVVPKLGWGRLE